MKVFPVVHITQGPELATDQATKALSLGADGVYLIDHRNGPDTTRLCRAFNGVHAANQGAFIGLNILGLSPLEAVRAVEGALADGRLQRVPDGLWVDDAGRETSRGETLRYKQDSLLQNMRYMGDVAFKYTSGFTEDPEQAKQAATDFLAIVDVVTTSGAGTGRPPTVAKIRAMKTAVKDRDLAVASGIDADNIADYAGLVDDLLVASSVESTPGSGVFHTEKLQTLIEKAHVL